jgi:hypothetical protein
MGRQDDRRRKGDPARQRGRLRPKDQDLLRRRDWQFAKGLFIWRAHYARSRGEEIWLGID